MSVRTRRVSGEIKKALSVVLSRDHGDVTDGLVTVTDVDVSPDLRNAKVFVTVLGGKAPKDKVVKLLNDRVPAIRTGVSRLVYLRSVPALQFFFDETGERAERIDQLLNEWHAGQPTDPAVGE